MTQSPVTTFVRFNKKKRKTEDFPVTIQVSKIIERPPVEENKKKYRQTGASDFGRKSVTKKGKTCGKHPDMT